MTFPLLHTYTHIIQWKIASVEWFACQVWKYHETWMETCYSSSRQLDLNTSETFTVFHLQIIELLWNFGRHCIFNFNGILQSFDKVSSILNINDCTRTMKFCCFSISLFVKSEVKVEESSINLFHIFFLFFDFHYAIVKVVIAQNK